MDGNTPQARYAPVDGLDMYYEILGEGTPLVVLHGSFMTVGLMGQIIPDLARTRQVIAVELQGHGHTADIDRPITYEHLADDTAELLRYLDIARADIYGYSLGGGVALQLAIRHPDRVRKLVVVSASYSSEGLHPEVLAGIEHITPELFDGTPWLEAYDRTAPQPEAFATLVAKLKQLDATPFDWSVDASKIAAPILVVIGDSDGTRPEHGVEMFRLRGGGVFGDVVGLPAGAQLAILPATTHLGMLERAAWLVPMVSSFLDAPASTEASL